MEKKKGYFSRLGKDVKVNSILYIMILPVTVYYILFSYVPMAGVQLAFKDYQIKLGIWGSPWIGFDHFQRLFSGYQFQRIMVNTVVLALYGLVLGMLTPVIFSLLLNYVRSRRWKKTIQMVTYLPYFISTVVMVGMLKIFLDDNGMFNVIMNLLGLGGVRFMSSANMFRHVFTWSGVWQGLGFSSVIYIATLSNADMQVHEAAIVDGASIWRRIWHIDLIELRPTILLLLILGLGGVINVGFEKILLMQNQLNFSTSEVLSTYIYKVGLLNNDYGFSTAVGLFNSVVSMVLLLTANRTAKKFAGYSLW